MSNVNTNDINDSNEVIAGKEAATIVGASYWHLLDLCKKGLVPHFRLGKKVLFRRTTLMDWITRQEELNQR